MSSGMRDAYGGRMFGAQKGGDVSETPDNRPEDGEGEDSPCDNFVPTSLDVVCGNCGHLPKAHGRPDPSTSGEDRGCSECRDWFDNPLNRGRVTFENPECPIRQERCVRFPDAAPTERGEPSQDDVIMVARALWGITDCDREDNGRAVRFFHEGKRWRATGRNFEDCVFMVEEVVNGMLHGNDQAYRMQGEMHAFWLGLHTGAGEGEPWPGASAFEEGYDAGRKDEAYHADAAPTERGESPREWSDAELANELEIGGEGPTYAARCEAARRLRGRGEGAAVAGWQLQCPWKECGHEWFSRFPPEEYDSCPRCRQSLTLNRPVTLTDGSLDELLDELEEDVEEHLYGYLPTERSFGRGMKKVIKKVRAYLED